MALALAGEGWGDGGECLDANCGVVCQGIAIKNCAKCREETEVRVCPVWRGRRLVRYRFRSQDFFKNGGVG